MSELDKIIQMADGFIISKVLFASVNFDIYTKLSNSEKTADELGAELDIPARSLERLLDVCVSLELLKKKNGKYSNTAASGKFLVQGKPDYFGYYCNARNNMLYSAWSNLENCIKKGEFLVAVEGKKEDIIGGVATNQEFAKRAMRAQHNYSQEVAVDFANEIDLSKYKVMVDLGGGTGIFSVEAVKKFPHLKAIVFDRPFVLEVAKDIIAEHNVGDRVTIHPGDILNDAFPGGADVALISGILDGYAEEDCKRMLKKAYDYLPKGGLLILTECVISDDRTGPVFAAIFSLLMLLRSKEGACRSRGEMTRWLEDIGFQNIIYKDITKVSGSYRCSGMLEATKK